MKRDLQSEFVLECSILVENLNKVSVEVDNSTRIIDKLGYSKDIFDNVIVSANEHNLISFITMINCFNDEIESYLNEMEKM